MKDWTYHVILGDGTDAMLEVGPFPTVAAATTFAEESMGRTGHDVDVDVMGRAIAASPEPAPMAEWRLDVDPDSDSRTLAGWTVERYDGEETDTSWSIDGGMRRELAGAL